MRSLCFPKFFKRSAALVKKVLLFPFVSLCRKPAFLFEGSCHRNVWSLDKFGLVTAVLSSQTLPLPPCSFLPWPKSCLFHTFPLLGSFSFLLPILGGIGAEVSKPVATKEKRCPQEQYSWWFGFSSCWVLSNCVAIGRLSGSCWGMSH